MAVFWALSTREESAVCLLLPITTQATATNGQVEGTPRVILFDLEV